jgi:hypothetical protein
MPIKPIRTVYKGLEKAYNDKVTASCSIDDLPYLDKEIFKKEFELQTLRYRRQILKQRVKYNGRRKK